MAMVTLIDNQTGYFDLHGPSGMLREALRNTSSTSELKAFVYVSEAGTGSRQELVTQVTSSRYSQISSIGEHNIIGALNRGIGSSGEPTKNTGNSMIRNISRNADRVLPKGRLVSLRGMGKRLVSEEELENAIERAKRAVFSGVRDETLRD